LGKTGLAGTESRLADATGPLPRSAAGRDRTAATLRLDTRGQVAALAGIRNRLFHQPGLASAETRLTQATGALIHAAARCDRSADTTGLRTPGEIAALTRIGLRQFDKATEAGSKSRLAGTAGTLTNSATRGDRSADALRLDTRREVVALAAIRLRLLDMSGHAGTETRFAHTTGTLVGTATSCGCQTHTARLRAGQVGAISRVGLCILDQARFTGTKRRLAKAAGAFAQAATRRWGNTAGRRGENVVAALTVASATGNLDQSRHACTKCCLGDAAGSLTIAAAGLRSCGCWNQNQQEYDEKQPPKRGAATPSHRESAQCTENQMQLWIQSLHHRRRPRGNGAYPAA